MINENLFKIENLKNVVLLGGAKFFDKIIKINENFKLKTEIISCSHQIKELDLSNKIKKFDKLDDKFKKYLINKYNFDHTIFISLGARYIFQKETINNFFKNRLINFHGTRLPYDSGGAGHSWKIMRHDRIDNQLVHIVDEGVDSGPVLYCKNCVIPPSIRLPIEIEEFRVNKFLQFYKEFILLVKNKNSFIKKYQPTYLGRYNPRLNTEINGWIDWSLDTFSLVNFINAFEDPYKGASTFINSKRVYVKKIQIHGGESVSHPYMSGLISRHDKDWLIVNTIDKLSIIIEQVLDQKGNNIINKLKSGDRFYTPLLKIENSKKDRIRYSTKGLK
jgi:methionyl-tRNA formyltransferase